MINNWFEIKASNFVEFNPKLSIKKGSIARKVSMDKLQPFTKKIPAIEKAVYSGGAKFQNGDTIMARITPCLENGKTSFVDILEENEIAFGSTEFIVLRARKSISDKNFIYYLYFEEVRMKNAIEHLSSILLQFIIRG